jgi:hypothetical protein
LCTSQTKVVNMTGGRQLAYDGTSESAEVRLR